MSKTIAVLMGGWDAERDVSLTSGKAVSKALQSLGYRVHEIDLTKDIRKLMDDLSPKPDIVFNALHGPIGEGGSVQGLLNLLEIPYTHSGVTASSLAMNKVAAKRVFADAGITVPKGGTFIIEDIKKKDPLPRPYVVKPIDEGSSVGVEIVPAHSNAPILESWHFGRTALVEEFIPGKELTVTVMGDKPLTVTEMLPQNTFYDLEAKYTNGITEHLLPAPLPKDVFQQCLDWALTCHNTLGCRGVTRTDFRYDPDRPRGTDLYVLETNTQPGMTPLSLAPEQASHLGLSFENLVDWMITNAAFDQ